MHNAEKPPELLHFDDGPEITAEMRIAARSLALAFRGNPFYEAILAGTTQAEQNSRLAGYFVASMVEGQSHGRLVFGSPPERGAAIWHDPAAQATDASRAKRKALSAILTPAGYATYCAIESSMSDVVRQLIPAGTWYLSILGVHPAHQGTGAGRALLAPTLDELDAIGAASYLETFTHPAVRFYQKLGYRIVGEATEPTLRESYWVMRRDPSTRAGYGSA